MNDSEVSEFVLSLRTLTKRIYDVEVPVIAALDGVALGKKNTVLVENVVIQTNVRKLTKLNFLCDMGMCVKFDFYATS